MVKVDSLVVPDNEIPNKSVIELHDDRVIMYLYAGNFSGYVAQVGYAQIQNVMYNDKRKAKKHVIRDHQSMLNELKMAVEILCEVSVDELNKIDLVTQTTIQTILWCYGFDIHEIHTMMEQVENIPYPLEFMLKTLAETERERIGKPHCWGEPNEECSDCNDLKECLKFFKEKLKHDEKKNISN